MKTIEQINKEIEKLEAQKKKLLETKQSMKWIQIKKSPFGSFEIYPEVLHKNMNFASQEKALQVGEEIASYPLVQWCKNQKLHTCFEAFWVNVSPNPDKSCAERGEVARFDADSGWADLDCYRDPSGTVSDLGVFVVRKKIRGKK